jgi:hypothetical protein
MSRRGDWRRLLEYCAILGTKGGRDEVSTAIETVRLARSLGLVVLWKIYEHDGPSRETNCVVLGVLESRDLVTCLAAHSEPTADVEKKKNRKRVERGFLSVSFILLSTFSASSLDQRLS